MGINPHFDLGNCSPTLDSPLSAHDLEKSGPSSIPPSHVTCSQSVDDCNHGDRNLTLYQPDQLARHQQPHIKSHKCTFLGCEYREIGFQYQKDMIRHVDSMHQASHEELLCPIPGCKRAVPGNGFPNLRRDNLNRHIRTRHSKWTHLSAGNSI